MDLQLSRLEAALQWVEKEFKIEDEDTIQTQSLDVLIHRSNVLCAALPFANAQMAIAKKRYNHAKLNAYNEVIGKIDLPPSLLKDYISAKLVNEQYGIDISERLSRTITHILDSLRTQISALKQELTISTYNN